MPRKKRLLKEIESDSEEELQNEPSPPPRKKSRRIQHKKQKQEEEEEKNQFDLEVTEIETIAIIAPSQNKIVGSCKIAAFDMDWTLIKPKSGKKFPQNRKDWIWMYSEVTSKLKEIHNNGYQIVIFSNQNGIGSGKQSLDSVSGKIIDLSHKLEIPIFGFLSIQKDHWRKPNTLMWDYFESHYNNNIKIDYNHSFYCGDAAGRPKGWRDKKTKKDFSCSDRKFAHNIDVAFHSPEPYFLEEQENKTWKWLSLNPCEYLEKEENNPQRLKDKKNWFHGSLPIAINKDKLDMVIMRGCPGSGKSRFAKTYLVSDGYQWVNRDTLKTKKKCLDFTKAALKNGKSVVIDNTNPDYNAREPFIKIGKQFKANIRLFNMNIEREVAEHMNLVRERVSKGQSKRIPGIAYAVYYKKVKQDDIPSMDEGFNEIVNIDLIPEFKDDKEKKLWTQFT